MMTGRRATSDWPSHGRSATRDRRRMAALPRGGHRFDDGVPPSGIRLPAVSRTRRHRPSIRRNLDRVRQRPRRSRSGGRRPLGGPRTRSPADHHPSRRGHSPDAAGPVVGARCACHRKVIAPRTDRRPVWASEMTSCTYAAEAAGLQRASQGGAEGAVLRIADRAAEHLAVPVGGHACGDDDGLGDDAAVDPGLEVGRVEEHVRERGPGQRPVPEGTDRLVQIRLTSDLTIPVSAPQRPHQVINLAGWRHRADRPPSPPRTTPG